MLGWEIEAILALAEQWGPVDRSYRKLAHRGSYLERVWVAPSTLRRVLASADVNLPARAPRPQRPQRRPWPEWVQYRPNQVWGYDVTHFGRPHTPTDQAPIESFFGHIKGEWPHLEATTDPQILNAELERVRIEYNTVRLHAGIGYVTPEDEHQAKGETIRQARRDGLAEPTRPDEPHDEPPTVRSPTMRTETPAIRRAKSETRQSTS